MTSPLLTRDEAIRYLRLDDSGVKHPDRTIDYYRRAGVLQAVKIGRNVRFLREDLDRFIREQKDRLPV